MTEYKQRSFSQRVGTAGENQFRLMADRQHLVVAAKVEEDFGVDFVCQAEQSAGARSTNSVIPAHFGVCVRSTGSVDGRVKLDRSDATNMLRYRQPLVFVLVHLVEALAPCYFRFLDPEFGAVLSQFLDSGNETMSLTPADCRPESEFRADLLPALKPSATRVTQLALAEIRLGSLVPGATVEVHLDKDGETAIIFADDYFDFFETLPEIQRNSVYKAAFGRPDLFDSRAADLPFKSSIPEALIDAPDRILVAGRIVDDETTLEISGSAGTAEACFVYSRIGTHFGWVHRDGLALTVGAARPQSDGTFVHETQVFIDDEAEVRLDELSADLCGFLTVAVPNSVMRDVNSSFSMEVDYFNLTSLSEIMWAHGDARKLPGWESSALRLCDLNDPFSLLAIRLLGTWSADPTLFPKLSFYIDFERHPIDLGKAERVEKEGHVNVVLDAARETIIAAVSGTATELWLADEMIGLESFVARKVELEFRALITREESYPEIVLGPGLSLVLDPAGVRASDEPFWLEGLEYTSE